MPLPTVECFRSLNVIDQLAAIYEALLQLGGGPTPPPFGPDQLTGLAAWYKDTGIQHTGLNVDSWNDASGNAKHLTSPNLAPQFFTQGLNGHDTVEFDTADGTAGTPLVLGSALLGGAGATLFIVVAKFSFWPEAGIYTGFGHAHHHPFSDTNVYDGGFSTVRKNCGPETVPIMDNWRIFSIRSQNGSYMMEIDGIPQFSTAANVFSLGTDFVLGAGTWAGNATAFAMQGQMAEVIAYNRFLNDIERDQVLDYLRSRFAL